MKKYVQVSAPSPRKRKVKRPKKTKQENLISSLHAAAVDIESSWKKADFPLGSNPKDAHGKRKPSMFAVPPVALVLLGEVMKTGMDKYGLFNWRGTEVKSSVYYDAILRHLMEWRDGEMVDAESGLHPLAHVMACCAILIDAQEQDTLFDDRNVSGKARSVIESLTTEG